MKKCMVAVLLVGFALAQGKPASKGTVPAKEPTIFIGMELQLGMSRDAIITRLASSYKTVRIQGEGDEWLIQEKGDPVTSVGHLGFTDGKLTYASRAWTQGGEDTYGFAQALHGAMAQMQEEGHQTCYFDVPSSRSPIAEMGSLRIYCGAKRIDVQTTNILNGAGKGQYASIYEVLSSEKNR